MTHPYLLQSAGVLPGARIAGKAVDGTAHQLPDPATGGPLAQVGWVDASVAQDAVDAARASFAEWAATPARQRAAALRQIAQALRDNATELAELISAESGKRLAEAQGEVGFSAHYFDWFADAATIWRPEGFLTEQRRFTVLREPVGVVAAVSPWNFPLSIPARKVAPALGAGCTVVQKASELTPLTSLAFTELAEPFLPAGVLNLVVGDGAELTTALVEHPDVALVSFTGSTSVGIAVATAAVQTLTRPLLELGGKGPFVITEKADLEQSLEALMVAKFRNNGASCIAANNVFVHESLAEEVIGRLRTAVAELVVGAPSDSGTDVGPLLRAEHVQRLESLIGKAEQDGARVTRASAAGEAGYYLAPALVEVAADTPLWQEEIFGPVLAIRSYVDEQAVVEEVNGWRFGLGGYVCSTDPEHAHRLAQQLKIGIVGVNNGAPNTPEVPFGGFGLSGLGREGGLSGLLEFTEERTISVAR